MTQSRHVRELHKSASEIGLSAVTLAEARTSNEIDVSGFSKMALRLNLTARAAATNVTCKFLASHLAPGDAAAADFSYLSEADISSPPTITVADAVVTFTTSVVDSLYIPADQLPSLRGVKALKLEVDGASGAAGDVLSVELMLVADR